MTLRLYCSIAFLVLQFNSSNSSIIEYFFPVSNEAKYVNVIEGIPLIPFEQDKISEKFLQEAVKLIGLPASDLDMCHHRVIMQLKNSCNLLTADQLGKLSVMLLNCQSKSEGRALYECTDTMSLKDCTIKMDSDTWNAYHLISNRAKAVCTAVRQDQFRALTEMAVNKLMNSAHQQISIMTKILEDHQLMKDLTEDAFNSLSDKNIKVIEQQSKIIESTDISRRNIESNLRDLLRERSLIKAGNLEVAEILKSLRYKIDDSLTQLDVQSQKSKENYYHLLDDLQILHGNAYKISDKLEEATDQIVQQTNKATAEYELTFKQLQQLNSTISSLAKIMNSVHNELDKNFNWITAKIGSSEADINNIKLILTYIGYLFFGMMILSFINADVLTRLFFMVLLPLNFVGKYFEFFSIDMITLTLVLISFTIANGISRLVLKNQLKQLDQLKEQAPTTTILENKLNESNVETSLTSSINQEMFHTPLSPSISRNKFLPTNVDTPINTSLNTPRSLTPIPSHLFRSSTPFNSGLKNRIQCNGLTMRGEQCRNAAVIGRNNCRIHDGYST